MSERRSEADQPPLTKRDDETQTEFAIRCICAEAWMQGAKAMAQSYRDVQWAAANNPYLNSPPAQPDGEANA